MIKDPNIDTRRTLYSLITDGKVNDGVKAAHGSKCINRYEWIDINNLRNVTFLTFSIIAHFDKDNFLLQMFSSELLLR